MIFDTYECLESTPNTNSLFAAVSLSVLILAYDDESLFRVLFVRLFGEQAIDNDNLNHLRQELKNYTKETLPPLLTVLINQYLRPRLADYLQQNTAKFLLSFASQVTLDARVSDILNPTLPGHATDIQLLAALTEIAIHEYRIN